MKRILNDGAERFIRLVSRARADEADGGAADVVAERGGGLQAEERPHAHAPDHRARGVDVRMLVQPVVDRAAGVHVIAFGHRDVAIGAFALPRPVIDEMRHAASRNLSPYIEHMISLEPSMPSMPMAQGNFSPGFGARGKCR